MRLYYFLFWILFMVLLVGCNSVIDVPTVAPTITLNPTRLQATVTPNVSSVPAISTTTPTLAKTTPTTVASNTANLTGTVTPVIENTCQEPVIVEKTSLASGLILRGFWDEQMGFAILGDNGITAPLAYYLNIPGWLVSLDGEWVANMEILEIINEDEDIYTIKIIVQDWSNEHIYSRTLPDVALNSLPFWVRDSKLVLPLQPEDDRFRWWIWDPVHEQEPYLLEVNLKREDNIIQPDTQLELDPLLEYVVYKCDDCSELEYWASNLATGDVVWKIPSDGAHLLDIVTYPSWFVDGQFLAFMAAELKDTIVNTVMWIFNRQGEKIYEIDMPTNEDGFYGGGGLSWSPDEQYLVFFRNNPHIPASKTTLGYLSLIDGSFTDLCLDVPGAFPIWSPDSRRLAFEMQFEAGLPARTIFIIDISSRIGVQIFDPVGHEIVGWRNLPDALP